MKQIYVSSADSKAAAAAQVKINGKGGVTLSPVKLGGWDKAFLLAQELGSWPKKSKQSKKASA